MVFSDITQNEIGALNRLAAVMGFKEEFTLEECDFRNDINMDCRRKMLPRDRVMLLIDCAEESDFRALGFGDIRTLFNIVKKYA